MSSKGRAVGMSFLVALLLILGSQELLNVGVAAANGPVAGSLSQDQNSNGDPCYRLCVKTLKGQGVDKATREAYCNVVVYTIATGDCGTDCAEHIDKFISCYGGVVPPTTCEKCGSDQR